MKLTENQLQRLIQKEIELLLQEQKATSWGGDQEPSLLDKLGTWFDTGTKTTEKEKPIRFKSIAKATRTKRERPSPPKGSARPAWPTQCPDQNFPDLDLETCNRKFWYGLALKDPWKLRKLDGISEEAKKWAEEGVSRKKCRQTAGKGDNARAKCSNPRWRRKNCKDEGGNNCAPVPPGDSHGRPEPGAPTPKKPVRITKRRAKPAAAAPAAALGAQMGPPDQGAALAQENAQALFTAMRGVGTDEVAVNMALTNASDGEGLPAVYDAFDQLLQQAYAMGIADPEDGDLVQWLKDDGMDDWAAKVAAANTQQRRTLAPSIREYATFSSFSDQQKLFESWTRYLKQ